MDVFPKCPLYTLHNALDAVVQFTNRQTIAIPGPSPPPMFHSKLDEGCPHLPSKPASSDEALGGIHHQSVYKLSLNGTTQMRRHPVVARNDKMKLNRNYEQEVSIPDKFLAHEEEFLDLFSTVENLQDHHLGRIFSAEHSIELSPNDARPVRCAPYYDGLKALQFAAKEI